MWGTINLEFKPGIISDDSELASEGAYVSGNRVRSRRGRMQTIGGWEKLNDTAFSGVCRGAVSWSDEDANRYLAFGTHSHFYVWTGTVEDITPNLIAYVFEENDISVTSGSNVVTMRIPGHGLRVGDTVTITNVGSIGNKSIDGTRTVTAVLSPNQIQWAAGGNALSSVTGPTSSFFGGYALASLAPGALDASPGVLPRTWSIERWGDSVVALNSGGNLFFGRARGVSDEILVNGTFTGNADGWALGGNWAYNSNTVRIVGLGSGNLSQNVSGLVLGGRPYLVTLDASSVTNIVAFKVQTNTEAGMIDLTETILVPSAESRSYIVPFIAPPAVTDLVIFSEVNSSRSIVIDNVSLKEVPLAPVLQAPGYSTAMIVDANGHCVLLGTVEIDGDYNPMAVRWCSQGNLQIWIPDTDNSAGEAILRDGGRIVGAIASRGQNLIFTDTALVAMQYTGSATSAFSFPVLGRNCGLIARHAAADHNGTALWMSSDHNFYRFDGGIPVSLDCPVRADVFDNINMDQASKIHAELIPEFTEVRWYYPRGEATECSHYVAYNIAENTWNTGELPRTCAVEAGTFPHPICFSHDGHLYEHEKGGLADGETMAWHLETGYTDIEDGHNLLAVNGLRLDSGYQFGGLVVTFSFKGMPRGREFTKGPFTVDEDAERIQFNARARQMKIRWQNGPECEGWRDGTKKVVVQKTSAQR